MKACPLCQSTYEDWIDFCFHDGAPLVAKSAATRAAAPAPVEVPAAAPAAFDVTDVPEPAALAVAPAPRPAGPPPLTMPAPSVSLSEAITVPDAPAAVVAVSEVVGAPVVPVAHPPVTVEPLPGAVPAATEPAAPFEPTPAPTVSTSADLDPAAAASLLAALSAPEAPAAPRTSLPVADPVVPPAATSAAAVEGELRSAPTLPPVSPLPAPPQPVPPPAARKAAPEVRRVVTTTEPPPSSLPLSPLVIGAVAMGVFAVLALIGWFVFVKPGEPPPARVTTEAVEAPPPAAGVPTEVPPPVVEPAEEPGATHAPPVPVEPTPAAATPTPPTTPASSPTTPAPKAPSTPDPVAATSPSAWATSSDGDPSPWGTSGSSAASAAVGMLHVITEPAGAQVYVNDVERGRSPLRIEIPYGTHSIKVTQPGYKTEQRDVAVRTPEVTVPFELTSDVVLGQLNLYGPPGYRVAVDGRDVGAMPVTVQVSEGTRQFKITQQETGVSCTVSREVRFRSKNRPETVTLAPCPM